MRCCAVMGVLLLLALWLAPLGHAQARDQGVDVVALGLKRQDGALTLEFSLRVQLPKGAEEALKRGVPLYFTAQATLLRERWYWRDERLARVTRQWRLAYQPLTATWRVGIGALSQSFASQEEALATLTRTAGWRVMDLTQLDPDERHSVDFSFRLDTAQLPAPLLVGLTSQADWQLGVTRSLRVE